GIRAFHVTGVQTCALPISASVKYIIASGGILDTILHNVANVFENANPITAALLIYFLTLVIEFFVSSGSAKAFLIMPIMIPLARSEQRRVGKAMALDGALR